MSPTSVQYHMDYSSLILLFITSYSSDEKPGSHQQPSTYLTIRFHYMVSELLTHIAMGHNFINKSTVLMYNSFASSITDSPHFQSCTFEKVSTFSPILFSRLLSYIYKTVRLTRHNLHSFMSFSELLNCFLKFAFINVHSLKFYRF